ncbi:hypothetical protein FHX72_002160 [Pseudoclavibacter helvolus]|uniref:Uncharacterized protein n=1 Tax=Pseudoclavibacter helvolus TaxID=255205 RepID=A0A7W4UP05_9MICO|nr:hypothetical protein [Pseudoclavibacter helvolus]
MCGEPTRASALRLHKGKPGWSKTGPVNKQKVN